MGHEHHDHEHDHEYMHEHNIPHDHPEHPDEHDHEYMHAHNIPHDHPHDHGCEPSHCASCGGCDPKAELVALMNYMVKHNAAHANELVTLAGKLRDMGDGLAASQVMEAVSDFEKGNMRLSAVLASMTPPKM